MGVRILDKELELRDAAAGAVTTATAETGIAVKPGKERNFKAAFHVTGIALGGTNAYELAVEADADAGFASPVELGKIAVSNLGNYEIPISAALAEHLEAGELRIRAKANVSGDTSPSITYGAFLMPAV